MADATPNSSITPATSAQFSFGTQIANISAVANRGKDQQ